MTEPKHTSRDVFQLGLFHFRLASTEAYRLELLETTFKSAQSTVNQTIDIDDCFNLIPPVHPIEAAIARAFRFHDSLLYVEGCVFTTSQNKRILLMGLSHAGKTTLTAALAVFLSWKIVTEDMVFIDSQLNSIISFVRPLSLRPGARQLISDAGVILPPLQDDRWLINHDLFFDRSVTCQFDYSVLLTRDQANIVDFSAVSKMKLLKMMLPMSNALHKAEGLELLNLCVEQSQCFILRNGTVKERLDFLYELVSSDSFGARD